MNDIIVALDTETLGNVDFSPIETLGEFKRYTYTDDTNFVERALEADILLVNKTKLTRVRLEALPRLKLVCVTATGMNNVDLEAAKELGITVKNVAGYSTQSVAQHTFALLFHLMGSVRLGDAYVKSGLYAESPVFTLPGAPHFPEIYGSRWGIIGMGNIGRRVSELAQAFGAEVVYHSVSGQTQNLAFSQLSLNDLLSTSDIVSIHCPLNRNSYELIRYEQLCQMKKTAYLINVARGKIIHEGDLARAINEKIILGAGLDVFAQEPINADNELLKVTYPERLALTPHTAWCSNNSLNALIQGVAENIIFFKKF